MNTKSKTLRPSPRYARNLELQTLIFGCVLTAAGLLPAAQLTLQHNVTPGAGGGYYQGVTDAWLEYNNEKNYGGQGLLYIGEHVQGVGDSAVVKFDLPAVTSQSIAGATLWLWYADTYQMNYEIENSTFDAQHPTGTECRGFGRWRLNVRFEARPK